MLTKTQVAPKYNTPDSPGFIAGKTVTRFLGVRLWSTDNARHDGYGKSNWYFNLFDRNEFNGVAHPCVFHVTEWGRRAMVADGNLYTAEATHCRTGVRFRFENRRGSITLGVRYFRGGYRWLHLPAWTRRFFQL